MLIALRTILTKAMQMSTQHAHIKYMLRVSKKELMRPQPVIPLNYCGDYEHLPPADHADQTLKQTAGFERYIYI